MTATPLPSSARLRMLPYCDDFLFLFASRAAALRGRIQIERTCAWLGITLSPTKCIWEPTQQIEHLGLLVDTERGLFLVPPKKETRIMTMANAILSSALSKRRLVNARFLASFVGISQSVYLAVPMAKLYLRSLHDVLQTKKGWNSNVRLSKQAIRDLRWWARLREQGLGRAIWRSPSQAVLYSDASGFAWGGLCKQQGQTALAHGLWTTAERKHHITTLELIAVQRNLEALLPRLAGKMVHLHEDNQAVCFILREYTTRSPVIMKCLRELWALMHRAEIRFSKVAYIRSAENPADAPSRVRSWDEWKLSQSVMSSMTSGPYSVDRFASQHTALCPRYNSLWSDPAAEGEVNAFANSWTGEKNWVHPPIDLLDDVVLKLREERCAATVVAPYWPSKSWFNALMELSTSMQMVPSAALAADPAFLAHWGVRGPGSWPLAFFHVSGHV